MRLRKRIKDINIDLNINTRPLDPGVIEEYAESMERYGVDKWQSGWKEMPKITHDLHLFSGFHTVHAAMQAFGEEHEITFDVQGDGLRDAFFLATEQNGQHGRRRSNAEKRNIVLRWLLDDEMKEWTDGHIADQCQVSQNCVTSVSNQLKSDLSGVDLPTLVFSDGKRKSVKEYHRPSKRKFLGKGGVQWIETEKIGPTTTETPSDYEHKNEHEFAVAKCDKAIRTYEEKQESLGLSELPWYGRGGFFYYAQAELEKQGEKLGYASHTDTVNRLSELAKLWESVTNAIKHNANWIKAVVQEEARKKEINEDAQLRKTLLDEIMQLQIHQVSPLLPEQYKDEWKESKAALKAAYPLYFSYANRNNLPIETLKKMKNTLLRMKKDLQENGIAKFLSDDYKERAAAHGELTQAYHKAQDAFKVHPLAEQMEFDDFEQEAEFRLELEEGLLCPNSVGGLEVKDIRHHKHLWDKVAKGLEQNVGWVQKILGEAEEGKERVATTEAAQASMDAAKESFLENREALGLADVSWEDFEARAVKEFKRRSADTLRSPSDQLLWSRVTPPAKLSYLASLWERLRKLTLPPAQDWVAEYAAEEASEAKHAMMEEVYEKGRAAFKAHPLGKLIDFEEFMTKSESYLEDADTLESPEYVHDSDAEEYKRLWIQVAEDLTQNTGWIAELLKTLSENKESEENDKPEQEQPTPLEIEPLGPADAKLEAEVDPLNAKPFEKLDGGLKASIREIARASKRLLKEDDTPEMLRIAASDMFDKILAFAGTDEVLKKMLAEMD